MERPTGRSGVANHPPGELQYWVSVKQQLFVRYYASLLANLLIYFNISYRWLVIKLNICGII
jgi:hypothetical protein